MRQDFDEAIEATQVTDFKLVSPYLYESILVEILDKFTTLGKKGLDYQWLWNDLKQPSVSASGCYCPDEIIQLFEPEEKIWFIAEDWHRTKKNGCFWLYETTMKSAVKILNEMYGFEYYIVDRKKNWMIGENHHDILFALGDYAISKVMESNFVNMTVCSLEEAE